MAMIPEDIDLRKLAEDLKQALRPGEPVGYLRGKALMRDILVHERKFSELDAEDLIDTLELRGFLRFQGDIGERSHAESYWNIEPKH